MKVWLDRKEMLIRPVLNVRAWGDNQVKFDWPTARGGGTGALVMADTVMDHDAAITELATLMEQSDEN